METKRKNKTVALLNTSLTASLLITSLGLAHTDVAKAATGVTVEKVAPTDFRESENNFLLDPTAGNKDAVKINATGATETYDIAKTVVAPNNPNINNNAMHMNKDAISKYQYDLFQDGFGAHTYFIDKADVSKFSLKVDYTNQATYKGEPVTVRVTYDNLLYAKSINGAGQNLNNYPDQTMIQISDNLYSGVTGGNIESLDMTVQLIDQAGNPINTNGDTFITFNSLNGQLMGGNFNEFVDYTNQPDGSVVQLTSDTDITEQSYKGEPVFAGTTKDSFADVLGSSSFKRNSVSYQVSGDTMKFKLGTLNGGGNGLWTAISSATLFGTYADAPTKTVNNVTANKINRSDVLDYAIPQQVQTLGVDALTRYQSWHVSDKIDVDGEVVPGSMYMSDEKGKKLDIGEIWYDSAAREVHFQANYNWLQGQGSTPMPMLGEKYVLHFQVKPTADMKAGDTIENTASSKITYDVAGQVVYNRDSNKTVTTLNADPNTPPTLTSSDFSIQVGGAFDPLKDMKADATDKEDGDAIDSKITVDDSKVDKTKPGVYPVTFTVTDASGEKATSTSNLTVTAAPVVNTPPTIKSSDFSIQVGGAFDPVKDMKVDATDKEDGDAIDSKITVDDSKVDKTKPGVYPVTFTVTDASGEKATSTSNLTVKAAPVVNTPPELLVGDVIINVGDAFDPLVTPNPKATDKEDPASALKIEVVNSNVNNKVPGIYDVVLKVTDTGGLSTTERAKVVVNYVPKDGLNGKDGVNGTNGKDGINGTDGKDGINGTDGKDGTNGKDGVNGVTPAIGENGNWWIDGKDTGMPAIGKNGVDGKTPYKGENGNWWIDGKDTGNPVTGEPGKDGADGKTPVIGENNNWWIDGKDTGIPAKGKDGKDGVNGTNGKDGSVTPVVINNTNNNNVNTDGVKKPDVQDVPTTETPAKDPVTTEKPTTETSGTKDPVTTEAPTIEKPETKDLVTTETPTTVKSDSNNSTPSTENPVNKTSANEVSKPQADNVKKPSNSVLPDTGNKTANNLLYIGLPILLIGAAGLYFARKKSEDI